MTSRMIVFSSPVPGQEEAYVGWYVDRHLPDILKFPGVRSGQFFKAVDGGTGVKWRHMGVYEIDDGSAGQILADIDRLRGTPAMMTSDALDRTSVSMLFGEAIRPWVAADGAKADAELHAPYRMVGLGRPVEGQQAEFDRWFDEEHLPDLLAIPGFAGVQRFSLWDPAGKAPWRHATLYAIDTPDPTSIGRELKARGPSLRPTQALDTSASAGVMFEALTPRRYPIPA